MSLLDVNSFDFKKPLSLYIHVPFCDSKCNYCAFYSVSGYDSDLKTLYVKRLLGELETVVENLNGRAFETAYIGGGNPACIGLKNLEAIAKLVCKNGRPKEFTVEMNPDSLNDEMLSLDGPFNGLINRLSLGIQSLSERALNFLGRNATLSQTYKGLELSQKLNSLTGCELSYDLITCLGPWHNAIEDVEKLTSNFPSNHLSLYALTLEEGTPLFKKRPTLPDEDEQYDILKELWACLETKGFEHYEVSNFAKNGMRGLHNCRYWDYKPYLGLGPGAASTAQKDGNFTRYSVEKSVLKYVKGENFSCCEVENLSREEALEELVLMGLRYKGGLDLGRIARDFGIVDALKVGLAGYEIENFVRCGEHLVPTDDGLMIADYIAQKVIEILLQIC